jgi:hypothetical protein
MVAWSTFAVTVQESPLDKHVRAWIQQSRRIKDFKCEYECKRVDSVFHDETLSYLTVTGTGAGLIRVDSRGQDRMLKSTTLFYDGKIHMYDWGQRSGMVVPWPPDESYRGESAGHITASVQASKDLLFVLGGIPPRDLTRRYRISCERQDADYVYVRSKPRAKDMQSVFGDVLVAFDKKEYGLRVLSVSSPPSTASRYTLLRRRINLSPPVTIATLGADLPREWTISQHPSR